MALWAPSVGNPCLACWTDGKYYRATVIANARLNLFRVQFDDAAAGIRGVRTISKYELKELTEDNKYSFRPGSRPPSMKRPRPPSMKRPTAAASAAHRHTPAASPHSLNIGGSRRSSNAMSVGAIEGRKLATAAGAAKPTPPRHARRSSEKPPTADFASFNVNEADFVEEVGADAVNPSTPRKRSSKTASSLGRSFMRRVSSGRRTAAAAVADSNQSQDRLGASFARQRSSPLASRSPSPMDGSGRRSISPMDGDGAGDASSSSSAAVGGGFASRRPSHGYGRAAPDARSRANSRANGSENPILKAPRATSTSFNGNSILKARRRRSSTLSGNPILSSPRGSSASSNGNRVDNDLGVNSTYNGNPILKAPRSTSLPSGPSRPSGDNPILKPAKPSGRNPVLKDARPPATAAGRNPILAPPKRPPGAKRPSPPTSVSSMNSQPHGTNGTTIDTGGNRVAMRRNMFGDTKQSNGTYGHAPKPRGRPATSPRSRSASKSARGEHTPRSPHAERAPRSPFASKPMPPTSPHGAAPRSPQSGSMQRSPRSRGSVSMPRHLPSPKHVHTPTGAGHPSSPGSPQRSPGNDSKSHVTTGTSAVLAHRDKVLARRQNSPLFSHVSVLQTNNSNPPSDTPNRIPRPISPLSPSKSPEASPRRVDLSHLKLSDPQAKHHRPMHISRTALSGGEGTGAADPTMLLGDDAGEWPDAGDVPWSSGAAHQSDKHNKHKGAGANGAARHVSSSNSGDVDDGRRSKKRVVRRNAGDHQVRRSVSPSVSRGDTKSSSGGVADAKAKFEGIQSDASSSSRRGPKQHRGPVVRRSLSSLVSSRKSSRSPSPNPPQNKSTKHTRSKSSVGSHQRHLSVGQLSPTDGKKISLEQPQQQWIPTSSSLPSNSAHLSANDSSSSSRSRHSSIVGVETMLGSICREKASAKKVEEAKEDDEGEDAELAKLTARECIIRELVDTERSYVQSLNDLFAIYVRPILTAKEKVMDEKSATVLRDVFGSIEKILPLNTMFLKSLEKRVDGWSHPTTEPRDDNQMEIADIVLQYGHFFKMYSSYAANHRKGDATLTVLHKNAKFAAFLKKCRADRSGATGAGAHTIPTLESFLIMPVQRMPRYLLLMRELLKKTGESHSDHAKLQQVIELVTNATESINEAVRHREHLDELIALSREFADNPGFISAGRYLVRRGSLVKRGTSDKSYQFFLFPDMLVYASQPITRIGKLRVHRKLMLSDERFGVSSLPDEDIPNVFLILNSEKQFVVAAKSPEDKDAWLKDFEYCIEKIREESAERAQAQHEATSPNNYPPAAPGVSRSRKSSSAQDRPPAARERESSRPVSSNATASASGSSSSRASGARSPSVSHSEGAAHRERAGGVVSPKISAAGLTSASGSLVSSSAGVVSATSGPPAMRRFAAPQRLISVSNFNTGSRHHLEMVATVQSSSLCSVCDKQFSMKRRRKTCAACAKPICSHCLTKELVPSLSAKHVRVCPTCKASYTETNHIVPFDKRRTRVLLDEIEDPPPLRQTLTRTAKDVNAMSDAINKMFNEHIDKTTSQSHASSEQQHTRSDGSSLPLSSSNKSAAAPSATSSKTSSSTSSSHSSGVSSRARSRSNDRGGPKFGGPPSKVKFGAGGGHSGLSGLASASRVLASSANDNGVVNGNSGGNSGGNMNAEEMLRTNMVCPMPLKDTILSDTEEEAPSAAPAYMDSMDSVSLSHSPRPRPPGAVVPPRPGRNAAARVPPRPHSNSRDTRPKHNTSIAAPVPPQPHNNSSNGTKPKNSSSGMSRPGPSPPTSLRYNTGGHTGRTPNSGATVTPPAGAGGGRSHTDYASRTSSLPAAAASQSKGPSTLPHTRPALFHSKSVSPTHHYTPQSTSSSSPSTPARPMSYTRPNAYPRATSSTATNTKPPPEKPSSFKKHSMFGGKRASPAPPATGGSSSSAGSGSTQPAGAAKKSSSLKRRSLNFRRRSRTGADLPKSTTNGRS